MADEEPLATLQDPRADIGLALLENPDTQEDFRDSAEFEELEAEFRKLETDGPTAVNWKQLNGDTLKVLEGKSKDLVLATRLAYGLFLEEGYPGLAVGLKILKDLNAAHWETMIPPVRRERGRAGALDWLAEKLAPVVEARPPEGDVNAEVYLAHEALLELDSLLEQKLTKSQVALGPLIRALRPLAKDAKTTLEDAKKATEAAAAQEVAAQEAAAAAQEAVPAGEAAAEPSEQSAPGTEPQTPADEETPPPAQQTAPPTEASQPAPADAPQPEPATAAAPVAEVDVDMSNVAGAIRSVANAAKKVAASIRDQDPTDARGYYLSRLAGWSGIHALPVNQEGKTALMPPQKHLVAELAALKEAGNTERLVASAENAFSASIFWLDTHYYLAGAMKDLGAPYEDARNLVIGELACLLTRFPDLAKFTFRDGRPFASAETEEWIAEEVLAGGGGSGGGAISELDKVFSEAAQSALAGKTVEGLRELKNYVSRCGSGRDWFKAQLKIGEFCLRFELIQPLFALLKSLRAIADDRDLAQWEPDLAVALARLSWQGLNHKNVKQFVADADAVQLKSSVMETLSLLDAGAAAELSARK